RVRERSGRPALLGVVLDRVRLRRRLRLPRRRLERRRVLAVGLGQRRVQRRRARGRQRPVDRRRSLGAPASSPGLRHGWGVGSVGGIRTRRAAIGALASGTSQPPNLSTSQPPQIAVSHSYRSGRSPRWIPVISSYSLSESAPGLPSPIERCSPSISSSPTGDTT